MLSPIQAEKFKVFVMAMYDNPEYVHNWQRLRGVRLTGKEEMMQFIKDAREIWDVLEK